MRRSAIIMQNETQMAAEFRESPAILRAHSRILAAPVAELVATLRRRPPQVVITCARGSSAHAATFGKHLIERHLGLPVAPLALNLASVYRQRLHLNGQLFLAISQAGRSEDTIESATMARISGALTAAIVNDADSPLAKTCDIVLPMAAGPERSVAATKSFVASLGVLLRLVASWAGDGPLERALDRLPARLELAGELDWAAALPALTAAANLMSLGRGPTLAIAREAALKLKETCNIHAEAFSGAEFLHGPIALLGRDDPILLFMPTDAAAATLERLAADLARKGASVFVTGNGTGTTLPTLGQDQPETDAVCLIQTFYRLVIDIAQHLGGDVDRPPHLQKVTRTR